MSNGVSGPRLKLKGWKRLRRRPRGRSVRALLLASYGRRPGARARPPPRPRTDQRMECPVCLALPEGEVHQCLEGHCFCHECWNRLDPRRCPQCRHWLPRTNRNRAAERAVAALEWRCEQCGLATTRGAMAAHLLACAERPAAGSPAGERRRSCWRRLAGRVRPPRARAAPPRRVRALQADDGAAAGRVPGAARAEPGAAR